MAQVTQTEIDTEQGEGSGNSVRLIINALFEAAATKNSGPNPPPDPRPNMEWHNTQDDTLNRRDAENSAWLVEKSFHKTAPPTTLENELNGYPQGSEWFMETRAFKHIGGGVWAEIGEAQAASLFAPTIGVLGGRRFAGTAEGELNCVVLGGPRFVLGASAPTPIPDRYTYGLIPSIRFAIPIVTMGFAATDPIFTQVGSFSYIEVASGVTGGMLFDFPILTAPTFVNLKISHYLSSGTAGTLTWNAAVARLGDMADITFGTPTTLAITASAQDQRQTSHLLLATNGAVIGDILRVRVSRASGGTAGTILITDFIIEQNP